MPNFFIYSIKKINQITLVLRKFENYSGHRTILRSQILESAQTFCSFRLRSAKPFCSPNFFFKRKFIISFVRTISRMKYSAVEPFIEWNIFFSSLVNKFSLKKSWGCRTDLRIPVWTAESPLYTDFSIWSRRTLLQPG